MFSSPSKPTRMASQGYRVRKPSNRRSGSLNYKSATPGLKTKLDIFAHTFFSPTNPNRGAEDRGAAWLQAEKLDTGTLIVSSPNEAADTWECKDCSWRVRTLAGKFNLEVHTQLCPPPTSYASAFISSSNGESVQLDSPAPIGTPLSGVTNDIEDLRRQTLKRDIGNRQPFYGVHQALFDLSRVSTVDLNTGVSAFGPVYSKYRKMIVIETWAEHVVCLPIFTYNGNGLEMRQGMVEEYMDVRDVDDESPAPPETHYEPLMAIRDERWLSRNTFITGKAVVKLTEKTTHSLFQKCSIEGKLEPAHFQRMYKALLELTQVQALEVFGKPTEGMFIMP
ncbi:uncharacterized protein FIESC28_07344 [Fusarium coffeatum]|uniref:DUF6590 domain-containing protein n=1 Tax=Fusarium coffeatum TaxID=231269 RepID=A0A366RE19_9HYPO|nr:uncharacterized protein FIESC28_07344 [Fusarium coffeatum]RBR15409.1 hypothetical protein FIESC28_07344 [Fusarium coffeatum]